MSVYVRPCAQCRKARRAFKTDKRGRKSCRDCKWIAVAPPILGRQSLGVFDTKGDAEAAFQQAVVNHRHGIRLAPAGLTVGQVLENYLLNGTTNLSVTTLHRYRELWDVHGKPLAKYAVADNMLIKGQAVALYSALQQEPRAGRNPLSSSTVRHLHRVLHRAFEWAVDEDILGSNIFSHVAIPKMKQSDARALTYDEAQAFFAAARGSTHEHFFALAFATAARRGELCALKWESVDLDAGKIVIRSSLAATRAKKKERAEGAVAVVLKGTKSGKARTVPLDTYGIAAFRRISAIQAADKLLRAAVYCEDGFVFTDCIGRPIKLDAPTKAFREIADSIGLSKELTLHSLRHTFASWSLASGGDIVSVQHLLGHSVPSTTLNLYSHAVEGGREHAVRAASETLQRVKARRVAGEN